jgi:CheY-like chemotaxis protein
LLELNGFQVEAAGDGREGVRKALAWGPQAAVVGIRLTGLDGYEVARGLRAAFGGRLLLIAFTAYDQPEDRQRAFAAGFDHHLPKPADPNDLLRLLQTSRPERRMQVV